MRYPILSLFVCLFVLQGLVSTHASAQEPTYDLVIYGGTSGGVAAAVPEDVQAELTLYLPTIINLAQAKATKGEKVELPKNKKWSYQLTFLDNPEEAGYLKRAVLNAPSKIRTELLQTRLTGV